MLILIYIDYLDNWNKFSCNLKCSFKLNLQADDGMNISLNIHQDVQYTIGNLWPFEEYTLAVNAYNEAGQGETYLNRTKTNIGGKSTNKQKVVK